MASVVAIVSIQSLRDNIDRNSWSSVLPTLIIVIATTLVFLEVRDTFRKADRKTDQVLGRTCAHPCHTCGAPLGLEP